MCTGLILAVELNRTMVLPRLLLDGSQPTDAQDSEDGFAGSVEFGCVVLAFLSAAAGALMFGMRCVPLRV